MFLLCLPFHKSIPLYREAEEHLGGTVLKCLTFSFGSGQDIRIWRASPASRSVPRVEPTADTLSSAPTIAPNPAPQLPLLNSLPDFSIS